MPPRSAGPVSDVGRGEAAGGEELARKQERKGKRGTPRMGGGGGRSWLAPTFG